MRDLRLIPLVFAVFLAGCGTSEPHAAPPPEYDFREVGVDKYELILDYALSKHYEPAAIPTAVDGERRMIQARAECARNTALKRRYEGYWRTRGITWPDTSRVGESLVENINLDMRVCMESGGFIEAEGP